MVKWPINMRLYKSGWAAAGDDSPSVYGRRREVRVICSLCCLLLLFAPIIVSVDWDDVVNIFDWRQILMQWRRLMSRDRDNTFCWTRLLGFNFVFWTSSMRSEGFVQGRRCGAVDHFVLERENVAWNGRRPRQIVTLSNTHWLFDCVCVCVVCVCEGRTDKRNR